jgi:hypothetical protein
VIPSAVTNDKRYPCLHSGGVPLHEWMFLPLNAERRSDRRPRRCEYRKLRQPAHQRDCRIAYIESAAHHHANHERQGDWIGQPYVESTTSIVTLTSICFHGCAYSLRECSQDERIQTRSQPVIYLFTGYRDTTRNKSPADIPTLPQRRLIPRAIVAEICSTFA